MQPDHIHLDTQKNALFCDQCGTTESLPPTFTLASLDHTINAFMSAHQVCTKPVAPAPVRHNGCWNNPRPTKNTWYMAQDGWKYSEDNSIRTPIWKKIFHVMSTDCRYDKPHRDAACAGCVHMNAPLVLESTAAS